jgi:hypothetical protein
MVEPHRAQQYMMVSFDLNLSEIGFPHYFRIRARHEILGLSEPHPEYMYIEITLDIGTIAFITDTHWSS